VPKVKKPRKGAKSGAAAASSAEESEGEKTFDEDEAAPRPKPKRTTRANPVVEEVAPDEGNNPDPVTPKARPRPRPIHRNKTPTGSLHGSENGRMPSGSPPPPVAPPDDEQGLGEPNNEFATPKSSLKRPRTDDVDEALEAPNGTSDPDHLINVDGTPDMQIRRKRIRH
jgi:cohesin complex subunit SA-1/2